MRFANDTESVLRISFKRARFVILEITLKPGTSICFEMPGWENFQFEEMVVESIFDC
jgi:hypothetical protein